MRQWNAFASEGKNLNNDSHIDRDALAVNCWFSVLLTLYFWAELFEKWILLSIDLYPVNNAIDFPNTYPLDSDLSGE